MQDETFANYTVQMRAVLYPFLCVRKSGIHRVYRKRRGYKVKAAVWILLSGWNLILHELVEKL